MSQDGCGARFITSDSSLFNLQLEFFFFFNCANSISAGTLGNHSNGHLSRDRELPRESYKMIHHAVSVSLSRLSDRVLFDVGN